MSNPPQVWMMDMCDKQPLHHAHALRAASKVYSMDMQAMRDRALVYPFARAQCWDKRLTMASVTPDFTASMVETVKRSSARRTCASVTVGCAGCTTSFRARSKACASQANSCL